MELYLECHQVVNAFGPQMTIYFKENIKEFWVLLSIIMLYTWEGVSISIDNLQKIFKILDLLMKGAKTQATTGTYVLRESEDLSR